MAFAHATSALRPYRQCGDYLWDSTRAHDAGERQRSFTGGLLHADGFAKSSLYAGAAALTPSCRRIENSGPLDGALSSYPQFSCYGGVGNGAAARNVPYSLSVLVSQGGVLRRSTRADDRFSDVLRGHGLVSYSNSSTVGWRRCELQELEQSRLRQQR